MSVRDAANGSQTPGRTLRRLARTGALLLCAAAAAAPGAGAQQRDREPTAEHLWEAYPLDDGTPPPVPTRVATPASRDRAAAPDEDDGSGAAGPLAALLGVVVLAAGGVVLLRRRARTRPDEAPARPAPPGPERGLPPPAVPFLPREAPMTPTGRFRRTADHPRPPEPQRPWRADVRWEEEDGRGRFRAVACSPDGGEADLLRSDPIPWPPSTDGARTMTEAVDGLEALLLDAGWQRRPKGDAWYARRYAWEPEVPAPAPPPREPRTRRPRPVQTAADPWTDAALQLEERPVIPDAGARWSCRIRWQAGWRSSRFEAIAVPPGRKRGTPIAASTGFEWTFKADPDPDLPAVRAAVAALRSELLAAGWAPAGIGRQWYAHRFAWTGDGDPPQPGDDGDAAA